MKNPSRGLSENQTKQKSHDSKSRSRSRSYSKITSNISRTWSESRDRRSRSNDRSCSSCYSKKSRTRSNYRENTDANNTNGKVTSPKKTGRTKNSNVMSPKEILSENPEKRGLDEEILEALGKRITADVIHTAPIHDDVKIRCKEIGEQGLSKEELRRLLEKHSCPKNRAFFDAPKLNLEVKASLSELVVSRDSRLIA